jgi:hypothetical protein
MNLNGDIKTISNQRYLKTRIFFALFNLHKIIIIKSKIHSHLRSTYHNNRGL